LKFVFYRPFLETGSKPPGRYVSPGTAARIRCEFARFKPVLTKAD
jgi:hypothetical protein